MEKRDIAWQELGKWIDEFDASFPEKSDAVNILARWINEAIESDFNRLVQWLYRLDVNEELLKKTLQENPETDAGLIIAQLAVERMQQKQKSGKHSASDWEETD